MWRYLIRRLLLIVPSLVGVSLITFTLVRMIPGDIVTLMTAEQGSTDASRQVIGHSLGLDQPAPKQYLTWIAGVVHGNLGVSLWTHDTVAHQITLALPVTIELALLATLFAIVLAVPMGVISVMRQDTWLDYAVRLFATGTMSFPGFWLGTLVLTFGALWFRWNPPLVYHSLLSNVGANMEEFSVPAIILALGLAGVTARMLRSSLLEVMRQDYVRTARAKGVRERAVTYRHGIPNAVIPVVTLFGTQLGPVIGGSVVMETLFGLPGLGRLTYDAINHRDYLQVQANVLLLVAIYLIVNLVIDLSYGWFDPRIRYT